MHPWLFYSLLATLFAGLTAVLAKFGLRHVPSDLAMTVRTTVVFALIWLNALLLGQPRQLAQLTRADILWLSGSGLATGLSWIYYYRAVQQGPVGLVASIDKGSVVITILLSWLVLGEPLTPKLALGGALIVAGLVVLAWK